MMKRLISAVVLTAATTIPAIAFAQTKLRVACPSAATNSTCLTATRFAEEANALSEGSLEVQVFPAAQLGSGVEAIQQTQAGIIDMVVEDITNYGTFNKDYNVISWGFAFRNQAHFDAFLKSDLQASMADEVRAKFGLRFFAVNWAKLPRVTVSTKPIFTPEDVKGLKFRVPGIQSYIRTWETLGTNPASVPWGESFQALKTGVVDAMEAPLDSVVSQNFHLAAPYVTLTNHVFSSITLAINESRYQRLTDSEKAALAEAAARAAVYSDELAKKAADEAIGAITADGGFVISVSSKPFQSMLAAKVDEQEAEGLWSAGLMAQIQAIN